MKKSITVHQKKRGRPATGRDPAVTIRLPQETLRAVEEWAADQHDKPARSPAIGRLIELGLAVKSPARQSSTKQKLRAQEIAAGAIDKMIDKNASPDHKATSKRRLLKGPSEFVDSRLDHRANKSRKK